MTDISYNAVSLQTSSIITQDIDHHSTPTKEVNIYSVAHGNKSTITHIGYPSKKISVSGQLISSSISGLDTLIDTFKGYFTGKNKNLDIEYAGSTRRYVATPTSVSVSRPGGLKFANFSISFVCTTPFGADTTATTLLTVSGGTTSPRTDAITVAGSAEYQYPIVTITLTAATGTLTGGTVSVGNTANGQQINIVRDWAVNDVIVVDPYNSLVTVNGTEVAFTGALPIYEPGVGSIDYADTFTTRTIDYTVTQYKYWL